MQKIYLAGPDVFQENAISHGDILKRKCSAHGFEGLFPLDNSVQGTTKEELAKSIRDANIKLIKSCDIVIANLSPFRGPEPDSGTVWEVGFAQALGKKVVGYCNDGRDLKTKTQDILRLNKTSNRDAQNLEIEDFGASHNLMYANIVRGNSFDECLEYIFITCKTG